MPWAGQPAFAVHTENPREPLSNVVEIPVYQREHSKPEKEDKDSLRGLECRDSAEAERLVCGAVEGAFWLRVVHRELRA